MFVARGFSSYLYHQTYMPDDIFSTWAIFKLSAAQMLGIIKKISETKLATTMSN